MGFLALNSVLKGRPDDCNAVRCNDGSVLCLMTPNLMPLWASRSYLLHVLQIYFPLLSAPRVLSCTLAACAAEENSLYVGWPWRWYRLSFINLTWFVKPSREKIPLVHQLLMGWKMFQSTARQVKYKKFTAFLWWYHLKLIASSPSSKLDRYSEVGAKCCGYCCNNFIRLVLL